MLKVVFILIIFIYSILYVESDTCNGKHCPQTEDITNVPCPLNDVHCPSDRQGFEAVVQLHKHMDDDHNGNLDRTESVGFIREELEHTKDGSVLQSAFHGTDDLISVTDLWKLWTDSAVYNWSTTQIVDWLEVQVDLPQYVHTFRINGVDGKTLPRMAVPNGHFTSRVLGIKSVVHKKKLALKAMDIVMFGPAKAHSYTKDIALLISVLVAIGVCWLAYLQNTFSKKQMTKVLKDLDSLQSMEDALANLNSKLENEKKDHKKVLVDNETKESILRTEMQEAKSKAENLSKQREHTDEEISRLRLAEEELVEVRRALRRAEHAHDGVAGGLSPIMQLQSWLQFTYEIETQYFEAKKEAAKEELRAARVLCDKMRKKRNAFLGSLRIAHSAALDDTDRKIMNAQVSLNNVKCELTERTKRWNEIETICGYTITQNVGINPLARQLDLSIPNMSSYNSKKTSFIMRSLGASNLMALSGMSSSISGSMSKFTDSDTDENNSIASNLDNQSICSTGTLASRKLKATKANGSFSSSSS